MFLLPMLGAILGRDLKYIKTAPTAIYLSVQGLRPRALCGTPHNIDTAG